jgi:hypothetical protein
MVVIGFDGPENWAKAHGVKFEFGSLPKRTNAPRVKFDLGPIMMVVVGFGGSKMGKSPGSKI